MNSINLEKALSRIDGETLMDFTTTTIYSTDASAYKEKPLAVIIAKTENDITKAIEIAHKFDTYVIPRTAGTSLAGQVVGGGIVVDVSKHLNKILEINVQEKWVRAQPGVVLDELNKELSKHGLFFGPETSTSNRCMIGGMVGNNSCGAHSLVYGSTRDHTLEISAILSDGSKAIFKELTQEAFNQKCTLPNLEGEIYRKINFELGNEETRERIDAEFPDADIRRRNTGYAVDILSQCQPFREVGQPFNFSKLLCGSEGTLAFITEVKLNLEPLPPKHKGLLAVHLNTVEEALDANVVALNYQPVAIELIDKFLLDCTKSSLEHRKNRFFLKDDPGALLCIEIAQDSEREVLIKADSITNALKQEGYGFHFPLLFGNDISKVWALRKAGLGLLSNIPGDAKPQPVIEDTAISPQKLPDYINEFNSVLQKNNLECVYYAHISTGELHLRPVLNLKTEEGVRQFRMVAEEIARLVKKYGGSLSGEHGDGRLRGEFIPFMIGDENYELLRRVKNIWDPNGVFNKGKITDTPPMDKQLRFQPGQETPDFETVYDFSETHGFVRMAEKCNGSADCRKSAIIGGTMCPSFQATRDEQNTTRARANMLREVINSGKGSRGMYNKDLYQVLDLCLSCKGCKSECPSGVDMAKLKSEFLYQYYKKKIRPIRSRLIASYSKLQSMASNFSSIYNAAIENMFFSRLVKKLVGFAPQRSLPKVSKLTWKKWNKRNIKKLNSDLKNPVGEVFIFVDEFTNYNEAEIGIHALKLLNGLGYKINTVKHKESGRAKISKGFLQEARELAEENVTVFHEKVNAKIPLIGIEPSAILSFRDEYPDLLRGEKQQWAKELANCTLTIEEFIAKEYEAGKISASLFTNEVKTVHYHGHCQQKALVGVDAAKTILSIPENYSVSEIKSGCCGMAGAFGYEKEHFDLSMKIGELILFPAVRSAKEGESISASGTSCRHQIKDGTSKIADHPVIILYEALLNKNSD